jgi:type IV pilus assembly protein PilP
MIKRTRKKPSMIKRNNTYLLLMLLIAGLLIPGGCNKQEQPPTPPPGKSASRANVSPPVQKLQSSAKVSGNPASSLVFTDRKDPFKSFITLQVKDGKKSVSGGTKDSLPIQSYDLSKFKVAGIIVGLKENRALVIDPSGKGYVVKQGMLIGDKNGRISKITATTIEVIENYRDDNGHMNNRTVKLTLPQKK